jgi:hypothetical protein
MASMCVKGRICQLEPVAGVREHHDLNVGAEERQHRARYLLEEIAGIGEQVPLQTRGA